MRVIAGSARRLLLNTPKGIATRPTTDRIKETLFNILSPDIYGTRFLDLFAGSGGIGIEALSRGASYACFVDNNKAAIACITNNLKHTGFENVSKVIMSDAINAISRLKNEEPFDIVFIDPPYDTALIESSLSYLSSSGIITSDTTIICEALINMDFSFVQQIGYQIYREKNYKSNKHVFLKLINDGGPNA